MSPRAVRVACYGVGLLAAQGLLASPALAGDWRTTIALGVSEEFTDNVDLATDGQDQNSDLITTVTPRLTVRGAGGRSSLNLDFSHAQSFFKIDSGRDDSQSTLAANGRVELWERVVFIDAQAAIDRQVTSTGNPSSGSRAGQDVNRTEVTSVNFSPFFVHKFGAWVDLETRSTLSQVTNNGTTADTFTNGQTVTVNSGRRFTQLLWNATIDNQKTARSDDTPANRRLRSNVDFTYVVDRQLSLLFGTGYEKIDDGTLIDQPDGPTWNLGAAYRPSSRTSLRLTYGDRFNGSVVSFDGSHQLSSRTRIQASFLEDIQTSQQTVAQNLSFIGVDALGNLIDTRTGLAFSPGNNNFGFVTQTFRRKRFSALIAGSRRRNTFQGEVFWESRKTDTTGIEEIVFGGRASLQRRLSRRTTARIGVDYTKTDFGTADEREADDLSVSLGLTYQVLSDVQATFNYILTKRDDDIGGSGFTENAVTVGVQKTF